MTRTSVSTVVFAFSLVFATAMGSKTGTVMAAEADGQRPTVYHRSMEIEGLDIFYREAGDPSKPTVLLLHGFPTSSHMFRNLIPALGDEFHVIAPDYPGSGNSSMPPSTNSTTRSTTLPTSSTHSLDVSASIDTASI